MRRILLAVAGIASGTGLLVAARSGPATTEVPVAVEAGPSAISAVTVSKNPTKRPSSKPSKSPTTSPTSRPPASKAAPKTPIAAKITGSVEMNPYGSVQVQITVAGKKITDVVALQYPSDAPRSKAISESAIPQLRGRVLAAQSASVDMVSGATFTSTAYLKSLQSAIDKAGIG